MGDALSMLARAPIRCEFQFSASSFGQDTLASGFKVGIGFGVNEGDMEKGQEGQKGWSGWSPYSSMYGLARLLWPSSRHLKHTDSAITFLNYP